MWLAGRQYRRHVDQLSDALAGEPRIVAITVSSDLFCLTSSSTRRSGVPTPSQSADHDPRAGGDHRDAS